MTRVGSFVLTILVALTSASVLALGVEFVLGKNWDADIEAPVILILASVLAGGVFGVDKLLQWFTSWWRRAARLVR